jgi:hypothetical protein
MARRSDIRRRPEVTEKIETNKKEMDTKETDLDTIASDFETASKTLENLEGGTVEGFDETEKSIEDAKEVTVEVFEKKDDELEEIQSDTQEFEGEIKENRNSSESDLGKLTDASGKIETTETINKMVEAKEIVMRDMEFLAAEIDRAQDAREKSDEIQEKHRSRIQKGGR